MRFIIEFNCLITVSKMSKSKSPLSQKGQVVSIEYKFSRFQVIQCWTDTFSLNNSDVNNIRNRDGVQTKVNDFGYTDGIGYLDKVTVVSHVYLLNLSYYELLQ